MKTRIFQTRFYDDEFIVNLDLYTQHLYLYLLTCQYINICGIFQLSDRKICFESRLNEKQLAMAKECLEKNKKVFFKNGWVYVVNALKNNNYIKSPTNLNAYKAELSKIPVETKNYFDSSIDSSTDSTIHSNIKYKIRNKKLENNKGVVKGEILFDGEVVTPEGEIHLHFCNVFGIPPNRYKLTDKRKDKVRCRLKEFTKEDIMQAIDNAGADDFYSGNNERGWKADLEYICRSFENTEKLLNLEIRKGDKHGKLTVI